MRFYLFDLTAETQLLNGSEVKKLIYESVMTNNDILGDFDFDDSRIVFFSYKVNAEQNFESHFEVQSLSTGNMWFSLTRHEDPRLHERLSYKRLFSHSNGLFRMITCDLAATSFLPTDETNELDLNVQHFESILR